MWSMMVLAAMAALAAGRRDDLCLVAPIRSSDDSTWQFRFDIPHNTPGNVQGPNALRFTMCNGGRHVTSRPLPNGATLLDAVNYVAYDLVPMLSDLTNGTVEYHDVFNDDTACKQSLITTRSGDYCVRLNEHSQQLYCDTNSDRLLNTTPYGNISMAHVQLREICDDHDRDVFFLAASSTAALDTQLNRCSPNWWLRCEFDMSAAQTPLDQMTSGQLYALDDLLTCVFLNIWNCP